MRNLSFWSKTRLSERRFQNFNGSGKASVWKQKIIDNTEIVHWILKDSIAGQTTIEMVENMSIFIQCCWREWIEYKRVVLHQFFISEFRGNILVVMTLSKMNGTS